MDKIKMFRHKMWLIGWQPKRRQDMELDTNIDRAIYPSEVAQQFLVEYFKRQDKLLLWQIVERKYINKENYKKICDDLLISRAEYFKKLFNIRLTYGIKFHKSQKLC